MWPDPLHSSTQISIWVWKIQFLLLSFLSHWKKKKRKKKLFLVRLIDRWGLLLSESYTILMTIQKSKFLVLSFCSHPSFCRTLFFFPSPFSLTLGNGKKKDPSNNFELSLACKQTSIIYFVSNGKSLLPIVLQCPTCSPVDRNLTPIT